MDGNFETSAKVAGKLTFVAALAGWVPRGGLVIAIGTGAGK